MIFTTSDSRSSPVCGSLAVTNSVAVLRGPRNSKPVYRTSTVQLAPFASTLSLAIVHVDPSIAMSMLSGGLAFKRTLNVPVLVLVIVIDPTTLVPNAARNTRCCGLTLISWLPWAAGASTITASIKAAAAIAEYTNRLIVCLSERISATFSQPSRALNAEGCAELGAAPITARRRPQDQ